jgi:hypothetical protein
MWSKRGVPRTSYSGASSLEYPDEQLGRRGAARHIVIRVSSWDNLKVVLAGLRVDNPEALRMYPMPEVDEGRIPPFRIYLAAWATDVAADLHARFGADVDLTVGSLPFPDPTRNADATVRNTRLVERAPLLPADEIDVWVEHDLEVKSGQDLRGELGVGNKGSTEILVTTNGQVTARVIDPETNEVAGGFSGAQILPAIPFRIAPGGSTSIPLLIGTSSSLPRLGYVIPPGQWAIEVDLDLHGRGKFRTPLLPISVVA